jgi:hypothetical protein
LAAFFAGFLADFFAALAKVVLLSMHEPNRLARSLVQLAR